MNIRSKYSENLLTIELSGDFVGGDSDEFLHLLNSMVRSETRDIMMEFTRVTMFSTHCLAKLMVFYNQVTRQQRRLRFTGLTPQLLQLFEIVDLDFLVVQQMQKPSGT